MFPVVGQKLLYLWDSRTDARQCHLVQDGLEPLSTETLIAMSWQVSTGPMLLWVFSECWAMACQGNMSRLMTKPTKWLCIQQRLRSAWASESSLCAKWVAKDPSFLHADSEDSDQTGQMPRLIWVFACRTLILLVLSCCGSYASMSVLLTLDHGLSR